MSKRSELLSIGFVDFWPGFRPEENFFIDLLREHVEVQISSEPKVLFFSCFGRNHRKYCSAVKFFFTGENVRPNRWECDYSLSFDFPQDPDREYRWPLYNLYFDPATPSDFTERELFCCTVVSNPVNPLRNKLFELLSRYRRVDSGGRYLNNVGGPVADKMAFIRRYRFCLALENAAWPGYTTEKLLEAKLAGCIPIYWGNRLVVKDFNPACFVNIHDFPSVEAAIKRIVEIDNTPELYDQIRREPLLPEGRHTSWSNRSALAEWLVPRTLGGTKRPASPILAWWAARMNRAKTERFNRQELMRIMPGEVG